MKMYECRECGSDFNIDQLSACPYCKTEVAFDLDGSFTGISKPCRRCGKIFSALSDRQTFCQPTHCGSTVEKELDLEEWLLLCEEVGYSKWEQIKPSSNYMRGVRQRFYDAYLGPWSIFLSTIIPSVIYAVNDSSATNRWANMSYAFGLLGSIFIGVSLFKRWKSERFFVTAAAICFFLSFAVLSQEDTQANYSGYDVRATCINDQTSGYGRDGPVESRATNIDIILISTGMFSKNGHAECPSFTYEHDFYGDSINPTTTGTYDTLEYTNENGNSYFTIGSKAVLSHKSIVPTRWNRNLNLSYTMGVLLCLAYYFRCRKKWESADELENPEFQGIPPIETMSKVTPESSSNLEQLERLADLKKQGFLTPEEFEMEKSKILRSQEY